MLWAGCSPRKALNNYYQVSTFGQCAPALLTVFSLYYDSIYGRRAYVSKIVGADPHKLEVLKNKIAFIRFVCM